MRKRFLQAILRGRYNDVRYLWRLARRHTTRELVDSYSTDSEVPVAGGPFRGLIMKRRALILAEHPIAMLIGSYEEEISAEVRDAIEASYDVFVDVGCAEGYYAVGFAIASPGTEVYAYDIDPAARALCRGTAEANGVAGRVHVEARALPASLSRFEGRRTFVMCDCEGGELDVLRPDLSPMLRSAPILVELHDMFIPGLSDEIRRRFEPTHDVHIVSSQPRDPATGRSLARIPEPMRERAVSENRSGPMEWAVMLPRG